MSESMLPPPLERMTFDVAFSSHDALKLGVVEAEVVRVVTEAPSYGLGQLTACQKAMAYQAIRGSDHLMPTATYPVY